MVVKTTIIIITVVCMFFTVWSLCVAEKNADEQMREIMEKRQEGKEKDMAIQRTCDRCGMPTGDTYYEINIYARSDGQSATAEALAHNLSKGMKRMNGQEAVYCKSCKNKIEQYMKMDIRRIMTESGIRERPPVDKPPKKGE